MWPGFSTYQSCCKTLPGLVAGHEEAASAPFPADRSERHESRCGPPSIVSSCHVRQAKTFNPCQRHRLPSCQDYMKTLCTKLEDSTKLSKVQPWSFSGSPLFGHMRKQGMIPNGTTKFKLQASKTLRNIT